MGKKFVYTKNIESFLQVTIFPKNKCIYKIKWPKMAKNGQKNCIYKNKMAKNNAKNVYTKYFNREIAPSYIGLSAQI